MKRKAFTLIELLVVIAIIAILAAILFPIFGQAKEAAKRTACVSNAHQIGLAVNMYLTESDGVYPIFYAYNSQPPSGQPGHKGVEMELLQYAGGSSRNEIFKCPLDFGGPYTGDDVPGARSYWEAYGSSYRFGGCMFSVVAGESSSNNSPRTFTRMVTESSIVSPSETRIIRDEMFSFFSRKLTPDACDRYGYDCDAPNNYFTRWHTTGGTMIFADSHAKHITGTAGFDNSLVDPDGHRSGDVHPTDGSWYWACD